MQYNFQNLTFQVTFIEHRSSIELYLKTKHRKDIAALDIVSIVKELGHLIKY